MTTKKITPKFWRVNSSLKTLDITCYKWFDRVNGNTYFACEVYCNKGMKNAFTFNLPFQYGYGSHFHDVVAKKLKEIGATNYNLYRWQDQQDSGVMLRINEINNCKKRELTAIKGEY